jgi:NAD(P)-dependent dehydrogenase (short-subunit alcohol dehydrogenase family)
MGRLEGKIAVITGAASGIGRASAELMAVEGARVVVADRNGEGATAVAAGIAATGAGAIAVRADVTSEDDVRAMIHAAVDMWGGLDVLHNNAGTTDVSVVGADEDIREMPIELWDHIMAVNLRGPMLGCKHALPHLIARGGGSIVNTSSMSGFAGDLRYPAYGASKGGLNAFTKYVATMYGKQGVRCNAVSPGVVATPALVANVSDVELAMFADHHLTPYIADPADIAAVVVFLMSGEARFITGQIVNVDGGMLAHTPLFQQMRAAMTGG